MSYLLLLITFFPLAVLAFASVRQLPSRQFLWVVIAPLPALAIALWLPDTTLQLPYLLFGVVWQLDDMSRALLAMTATLWLLAGVFAWHYLAEDPRRRRFTIFWLMTMVGNFALLMGKDIASFYTGFALMTFAGYGLVVHSASREALHAGRVYLAMAIMGEVLILAGFILILPGAVEPMMYYVPLAIAEHSSPYLVSALLLAGFGVKAGLLGLHLWLPLAHPVAPTPASAVLSGAMIKAGLVAWMQVLPLQGEAGTLVNMHSFGLVVVCLGLAAAFYGGLVGVMQRQAKAVLAYSSVSQMGLMTTLVGVGMLQPDLWPGLATAVVIYMVHHGLAKGALFLCVGLAQHPGRMPLRHILTLAAIPALALVGAPLTSGSWAKYAMKNELYTTDLGLITLLLTLAAVATGVLMLRFLVLLKDTAEQAHSKQVAPLASVTWAVYGSVLASLLLFWWLPVDSDVLAALNGSSVWDAAWTLGLALLLAALAYKLAPPWRLPAGDLIWPAQSLLQRIARLYGPTEAAASALHQAFRERSERVYYGTNRTLTRLFSGQLSERTLQRHIALFASALIILFMLLLVIPA